MRRSAALVDQAVLAGYEASVPGASADHINAAVNASLLENGGEYMGLPPFVLAGERSCLPHQTGGNNRLARVDVMYFEISAARRRYAAALLRTIFLGSPKEECNDSAHPCMQALNNALEIIK